MTSQAADTLDRLTDRINPIVAKVNTACLGTEYEQDCDLLYDAYIEWYDAYEMVVSAIESDDRVLISRTLQHAIAKGRAFIKAARDSKLIHRE